MSQSQDGSSSNASANSSGSSPASASRSDSDSSASRHRNRVLDGLIRKRLDKMRLPKVKKEKESKFKFVSNRDQHQFNESVLAELDGIKVEGRSKRRLRAAV